MISIINSYLLLPYKNNYKELATQKVINYRNLNSFKCVYYAAIYKIDTQRRVDFIHPQYIHLKIL